MALQHAAHVVPIEDDYVIGKELGRGRFSVVCECVNKLTGVHCAVKIIGETDTPRLFGLLMVALLTLSFVMETILCCRQGHHRTRRKVPLAH